MQVGIINISCAQQACILGSGFRWLGRRARGPRASLAMARGMLARPARARARRRPSNWPGASRASLPEAPPRLFGAATGGAQAGGGAAAGEGGAAALAEGASSPTPPTMGA